MFPFVYRERFRIKKRKKKKDITNIIPHSPDDDLLELKRYSVNFASQ